MRIKYQLGLILLRKEKQTGQPYIASFDGPFQLIHADVGNLEVLGKNSATPRHVLVVVDLYLSKVYVYPTPLRK